MKCRITNKKTHFIHSFGKMPIANNFLDRKDNFNKEFFFNLGISFSEDISLLQLSENPNIEKMFHDNYAFISGTSTFMDYHFQQTANWLIKNNYLDKNKKNKIIEIGSNDGIFLKNFNNEKNKILAFGFEPSKNVYELSKKRGTKGFNCFFSYETAKSQYSKIKNTDVVYAANAFCHIPNLKDVIEGIDLILKDDGYLIFEDPYLGSMLSKTSYDQIYDEHIYIFSAIAVKNIFKRFNFTLVDALPLNTHGGSMRYVVKKNKDAKISSRLHKILKFEEQSNFEDIKTYKKFSRNCEILKKKFKSNLIKLKNNNKNIFGYGATSKSTTILNYCDIGIELIDYILDTTPTKHWKYTPGKHIPVLPYDLFKNNFPDVFVLFAWNHEKEIKIKEKKFSRSGNWITHLD
jgi:SAM-dependent methyltransferase